MKNIPIKVTVIFMIAMVYGLSAQGNLALLTENIRLPKDSVITKTLLTSFNGFLKTKNDLTSKNRYVLPAYALETSMVLDELKDIEKSTKYKDDNFYRCYLSNILKLTPTEYMIQFYFMGIHKNTPILRANYTLLAKYQQNQFYFYSPLQQNTASWQEKTMGNTTFHYKNTFAFSKAKEYLNKAKEYDAILGVSPKPSKIYCAENFQQVMQLIGVDFKADYNGYSYDGMVVRNENTVMMVDGVMASNVINFDPHDLWHSRLQNILPYHKTYKPVDEGCAFLFGGSWGYSWQDILDKFKRFVATHPDADWLALYDEGKNYGDEAGKALRVDYTINALLVKKIKKEQGFPAVFKLLSCGKKNEDYFPVLKEVTGITRESFNSEISELIQDNIN